MYEVIFLGIESFLYILITIRLDILSTKPHTYEVLRKMKHCLTCRWLFRDQTHSTDDTETVAEDDEDVHIENERVRSGEADNDLVVLHELSKVYPNGKRAVDLLSLGIPSGQCFGLLGINGAGKIITTAMMYNLLHTQQHKKHVSIILSIFYLIQTR